jgi:hypothetical protein
MEGIRNWVITQLVKQGIIKVLSFLNPAGALLQAALAIYNAIMFFVDNWQRISDFVNSIFTSIGKIAAGNIGAAASFIEKAMAQSIPIILNFIARLLNIGAIGKAIKKIIQKIRKPIDKVVNKAIGFIAKQVKKFLGKLSGKKGAKKIKEENKKEKPGKITAKDKTKHKKIAKRIEEKLKKNGIKEKEEFKSFHQRKKKEGEVLENQYQPQLKKGINLDVKFKAFKEDEKDGDMDVRITIKPNNLDIGFAMDTDTGDVKDLPIKKGDLLKAKYNKGKFLADATKVDKPKKQEEHEFRYKKLTKKIEKNTFSEFKKKWDKGDIEKVNEERKHLIENRPTHKSTFRQDVWDAAPKKKDKNGIEYVRDPNVKRIKIYEDDNWDAGHKTGEEYRYLVDEYIKGEIDWEGFLKNYHDIGNYQIEDRHENRSHKHENKK